jgi:hypothetical protein
VAIITKSRLSLQNHGCHYKAAVLSSLNTGQLAKSRGFHYKVAAIITKLRLSLQNHGCHYKAAALSSLNIGQLAKSCGYLYKEWHSEV